MKELTNQELINMIPEKGFEASLGTIRKRLLVYRFSQQELELISRQIENVIRSRAEILSRDNPPATRATWRKTFVKGRLVPQERGAGRFKRSTNG